ncbi:hypothetical protein JHK87_018622 [Glycine soja]|nr:hypothetical protein JHK87_018622 [Glycine soja]
MEAPCLVLRFHLEIEVHGNLKGSAYSNNVDVEEGGETVFPDAKGNLSFMPWWNELSECRKKKRLSIKLKRIDALLFWSMKLDATLDPSSLHDLSLGDLGRKKRKKSPLFPTKKLGDFESVAVEGVADDLFKGLSIDTGGLH